MNAEERESLEAAGWTFGDAEDFLGLSPEERRRLERRMRELRPCGRCGRETRQMWCEDEPLGDEDE